MKRDRKMNHQIRCLPLIWVLGAMLASGCVPTGSPLPEATSVVSPTEVPTEEVVVETEAPTPEPTPTPEPEPPATDEPVTYDYEGWEPFQSDRFGYAFLAPPDVEVVENGMDGTVTLAGPLVDNERWPCITISSADSDVFRPPSGTDVVEWIANSPLTTREVESGVEIGGLPSAHVVTEASSRVYAADDYYVIHEDRLIRIAITHCGQEDWEMYNAFLASFTFDGAAASVAPGWSCIV